MLRIILHPAFNRRSERLHGQFVATLDGRRLCISHEPLLAASRILLAAGVDPADAIAMRHQGAAFDALTATIGAAARLTVEEGEKVGPRSRPWRPFAGVRVGPSMRFSGEPVPDTGRGVERIHEGASP